MALLEIDDIHTYYGNIEALKGVSLTVDEGECVTLIGSNGAGKSTTLRSISGLTPPRTGDIRFDGENITRTAPQEIVRLGISHSPEGRRCFPRLTVRENLDMGACLRRDAGIGEDMERVYALFPRLQEREKQKAGTMSGGEQRMLAIGRALMAKPKLLLLDEPSMGIAPILVERIYETIAESTRRARRSCSSSRTRTSPWACRNVATSSRSARSRSTTCRRTCARSPTSRGPTSGHDVSATLAVIGAQALYLLYGWLLSAIIASYLSDKRATGSASGWRPVCC